LIAASPDAASEKVGSIRSGQVRSGQVRSGIQVELAQALPTAQDDPYSPICAYLDSSMPRPYIPAPHV